MSRKRKAPEDEKNDKVLNFTPASTFPLPLDVIQNILWPYLDINDRFAWIFTCTTTYAYAQEDLQHMYFLRMMASVLRSQLWLVQGSPHTPPPKQAAVQQLCEFFQRHGPESLEIMINLCENHRRTRENFQWRYHLTRCLRRLDFGKHFLEDVWINPFTVDPIKVQSFSAIQCFLYQYNAYRVFGKPYPIANNPRIQRLALLFPFIRRYDNWMHRDVYNVFETLFCRSRFQFQSRYFFLRLTAAEFDSIFYRSKYEDALPMEDIHLDQFKHLPPVIGKRLDILPLTFTCTVQVCRFPRHLSMSKHDFIITSDDKYCTVDQLYQRHQRYCVYHCSYFGNPPEIHTQIHTTGKMESMIECRNPPDRETGKITLSYMQKIEYPDD